MRQALILVGGKGTRLGALTASTPKPLLPIGDAVFLDYLLAMFARQGVQDLILSTGYLGEEVERRYEGAAFHGARVQIAREPEPAGTAGALRYAASHLDPIFLMANGDSLFDFDHRALESLLAPEHIGALALRRVPDGARYGSAVLRDGHISAFREKDPAQAGEALVSAGVYVLRRDVLGLIGDGLCSIETDIFPKLAAEGALAGLEAEGYFIDIGLSDTLEQARRDLPMRFPAR